MAYLKIKQIRAQIAKWKNQIGNGRFSSATVGIQTKAHTQLQHWETELDKAASAQARRKAKR